MGTRIIFQMCLQALDFLFESIYPSVFSGVKCVRKRTSCEPLDTQYTDVFNVSLTLDMP